MKVPEFLAHTNTFEKAVVSSQSLSPLKTEVLDVSLIQDTFRMGFQSLFVLPEPPLFILQLGWSESELLGVLCTTVVYLQVDSAAPDSRSVFEGTSERVFVPSGNAASLEEEDGSHFEENKGK